MDGGPIWVVAEQHAGGLARSALDLAGVGRQLADRAGRRLEVVLLGSGRDPALALGRLSADAIYAVDRAPPAGADLAPWTAALGGLVERERPSVVLYPADTVGGELACATSARFKSGLMSHCARLDVDGDGRLLAERPVYDGRATATVVSTGDGPAMATVMPGVRGTAATGAVREAPVVHRVDLPEVDDTRVVVERSWRPGPWDMDLAEADVIVAGGRGAASAADFGLLAELAGLLGGAVGASRPVVDAGVAPYDRQVGLSGRIVSPRLYVACGISGAVHHLIGMRGAEAVIAINRDPHAPIFDLADLGIVGDVRDVVPGVIERLRAGQPRAAPADEEAVDALRGTARAIS